MRVILLKTDGTANPQTATTLHIDNTEWTTLHDHIHGYIEIVRPKDCPKGLVMVVDEEGKCKQKPLNKAASMMYGCYKHGDLIVGDVILCQEAMTDEGPELFGMSDVEFIAVTTLLKALEVDITDLQITISMGNK
jgi:hypothetical protein